MNINMNLSKMFNLSQDLHGYVLARCLLRHRDKENADWYKASPDRWMISDIGCLKIGRSKSSKNSFKA